MRGSRTSGGPLSSVFSFLGTRNGAALAIGGLCTTVAGACLYFYLTSRASSSSSSDPSSQSAHGSNFVGADGVSLTMADMEKPLPTTQPSKAIDWMKLGDRLYLHGTQNLPDIVSLDGKTFRPLDCFQEAVKLEPKNPKAWLGAARVAGSNTASFNIGDLTRVGRQECLLRALELDPKLTPAWNLLGWMLEKGATVDVAGNPYSRTMCFLESLRINPKDANAWLFLGTALPKRQIISVNGEEISDIGCYVRALELNPKLERGWQSLGLALDHSTPDANEVVVRGVTVTEITCFVEVLNINDKNADAWFNLGTVLPSGGTATIQGREVNEVHCFQQTLELNPNNAEAWYSLGVCLGDGQAAMLNVTGNEGDDEQFTKKDCYVNALAVNETLHRAWYNLALELKDGATVYMHTGEKITALDCCAKSVEHSPGFAKGWHLLAKHLGPTKVVIINGREYDAAACTKMGSLTNTRLS